MNTNVVRTLPTERVVLHGSVDGRVRRALGQAGLLGLRVREEEQGSDDKGDHFALFRDSCSVSHSTPRSDEAGFSYYEDLGVRERRTLYQLSRLSGWMRARHQDYQSYVYR